MTIPTGNITGGKKMPSEKPMFDKILDFAKNNELVRAVYMNGSRANPNVEEDILRDYDIVYVVTEIEPFMKDISWLDSFGDIAILQDPNMNDIAFECLEYDIVNRYNWLILYKDHNRIDLGIQNIEYTKKEILNDSLTVILLDKDNILPEIEESSDRDYHVRRPTKEQYNACVNNFWWCTQNVAKGIRRMHIPYALNMYNIVVRDMLDKMVNWYIGYKYNFSVSVGKWGKYYSKFLEPDIYNLYEKTYSDCKIENIWDSVHNALELFSLIANDVAEASGYRYNKSEEEGIRDYISFVRDTEDIAER